MRVLVTGAQGCIGSWVVKQLLDRGIDVLAFDVGDDLSRLRLISEHGASPRLRAIAGKIEDGPLLKALVREECITHVVHLAAVLMPVCHADPVLGAMVNVVGTLHVFEAARAAGRPVRVVYASSSAVWGPEEAYGERALKEEDPLQPGTHYGVFKQANEGNARVYWASSGIASIGLRPWTVYGVGRDRGMTADATLAMKAVVLGKPFRIRISGHMDLQYVEDVAETFVRCALTDLEGAHVLNLAGDIVRMDHLVEMLERMRPGAAGLVKVEGPPVPVSYRMDGSQLRALIPGIPATGLEEGVERTLALFERLQGEGRLSPEL